MGLFSSSFHKRDYSQCVNSTPASVTNTQARIQAGVLQPHIGSPVQHNPRASAPLPAAAGPCIPDLITPREPLLWSEVLHFPPSLLSLSSLITSVHGAAPEPPPPTAAGIPVVSTHPRSPHPSIPKTLPPPSLRCRPFPPASPAAPRFPLV